MGPHFQFSEVHFDDETLQNMPGSIIIDLEKPQAQYLSEITATDYEFHDDYLKDTLNEILMYISNNRLRNQALELLHENVKDTYDRQSLEDVGTIIADATVAFAREIIKILDACQLYTKEGFFPYDYRGEESPGLGIFCVHPSIKYSPYKPPVKLSKELPIGLLTSKSILDK